MRILDILISSILLVLLSPLLLGSYIVIRARLGSPTLFRQKRPGLHGKPFMLIKFRTMTDAKHTSGELKSDAERLTDLGKLLRKTSIDELPTLVNVLKGDMSLVGPRPLLMKYLPLYSDEQAKRHNVRPGITGWAQINGRNSISWDEKFKLDVWYVNNKSLLLDMRILWLTVGKTLRREGISAADSATMTEFKGLSTKQ